MNKKCIYCGGIADTVDHIPPKNLFPTTRGLKLVTVPSCDRCNKGFSLDEVFFRDHMAVFTVGRSITSDLLFDTKIKRSIIRRPKLAYEMFSRMSKVDYKVSDLYMGKRTAVKMLPKDWDRIYNILEKIIRGLFYDHFDAVIPNNFVFKHVVTSGPELLNKHSKLLPAITWNIPQYDYVFRYGYAKIRDMADSIWITDFFKNASFMTFVRNPINILEGRKVNDQTN